MANLSLVWIDFNIIWYTNAKTVSYRMATDIYCIAQKARIALPKAAACGGAAGSG
jgi:hypothetical protein